MNKTQLKARCKELGIPTEDLTTNDLLRDAIAKREAELEAEKAAAEKAAEEKAAAEKAAEEKAAAEKAAEENAAAEKAAEEKAAAEKAAEEKAAAEKAAEEKAAAEKAAEEQEPERLIYEDKRGRKWIFKSTAPKTLNIDGHTMSQREIFDNEDIISELVYGNSSFLTQIIE